jgi:NhaP-type Na+/H+ or K+/H+ antiporter
LTVAGWILLFSVGIGYLLISKRLNRSPLTGPMIFVGAGLLFSEIGPGVAGSGPDLHVVGVVLEITLALVLFTDALAIDLRALGRESSVPIRLLGIGLPLTMLAGVGLALLLFDSLDFWHAAVLAVVLAPTDAALGQAVVANPRVPRLIRQGLSSESGLNDGLAVPFLSIAVVGGLAAAGLETETLGRVFLAEIGIGVLAGLGAGLVGGRAIRYSSQRDWGTSRGRGLVVSGLAVVTFLLADSLGGSGFIAAFVGGVAFGAVTRSKYPEIGEHSEGVASVLTLASFFLFGFVLLGPNLDQISVKVVAYAVLSLTVIRMLPVAIAMTRSKLNIRTKAYLGWFGPRGLASLVFAVTVVADSQLPEGDTINLVVATTVALSVLLHGMTAYPGSRAYANWFEKTSPAGELSQEATEVVHLRRRDDVSPGWHPEDHQ